MNDLLVSTALVDSGSTTAYRFSGVPGDRLSLEVIDNSPLIHPSIRDTLASRRTWEIVAAVQPGDANCDGRISAADLPATLVLLPTGALGQCGADANCDGQLDQRDVSALHTLLFDPSPACARDVLSGEE